MPVTSALAAAYTISDRWFASGPVQTFANRIFNHCATPGIRKFSGWPAQTDPSWRKLRMSSIVGLS